MPCARCIARASSTAFCAPTKLCGPCSSAAARRYARENGDEPRWVREYDPDRGDYLDYPEGEGLLAVSAGVVTRL